MFVTITTSGITTSWSWREFPFDWKMQFIALQGREPILKHSFPISSVWFGDYYLHRNSSPISAGSDIKFKRVHIRHLFTMHLHLYCKPGLCLTLYTQCSKFSQHWKQLLVYPFQCETEANTELLTQDRIGIREGAAWFAWAGSLHAPSRPVSQGSQLSPDLHFWRCMDFNLVSLIGIKYFWLWK